MNDIFRFAGIGSRETPENILKEMIAIGKWAKVMGFVVGSGHAPGADLAFELGATENTDVFLPWKGFNKEAPVLGREFVIDADPILDDLVRQYHPTPWALSRGSWALMRRNGAQVLGLHANEPVGAVVCYRDPKPKSSGTDQAIRIADGYKIPVMNMFSPEWNSSAKVIAELTKLAA